MVTMSVTIKIYGEKQELGNENRIIFSKSSFLCAKCIYREFCFGKNDSFFEEIDR
jgi:hypothetical protein